MSKKSALVALLGATAVSVLLVLTPAQEGTIYTGYLDAAGIPTKCMGDTRDVVVGKRYSAAECRDSLLQQLAAHAEPVLESSPNLKHHPWVLAAAVDHNYNTGAWSRTDAARHVAFGRLKEACRAFMWSDSGKRVYITARNRKTGQRIYLRGLDTRRQLERLVCEHDVGAIEPWQPSDAALAAYKRALSGQKIEFEKINDELEVVR